MSSEFGNILHVTLFGQSHGPAVGMVMDGLPAGERIDLSKLQDFMNRRKPGKDTLSTSRKEADIPEFISGLTFDNLGNGITCGAPLCAVLKNTDQQSFDYDFFRDIPRPGHADFTALYKWKGFADLRGGGHLSGRLTAPLCVAGGIARQILSHKGIVIGAHLFSVGDITDISFPPFPDSTILTNIARKSLPVLDDEAGDRMKSAVLFASTERDSVGGIVECATIGVPVGLGNPLFDGVESRLASAIFGIPAVKGVEFGDGFHVAEMRGSENNDPYVVKHGSIQTASNHCGGILGGITTGMPIMFRVAFKPTPSIAHQQRTVNVTSMEEVEMSIKGRHDPCVAIRAVPVVEAVTACVLLNLLLEGNKGTF